MALAENTAESEGTLCPQEIFPASGNAEDGGGRLDVIEVQSFSADVNSNVRLDENDRESKHTAFPVKTARDQAVKMDDQEFTCSFYLVSPENAEDGTKSQGDKSHDGEVSLKDPSCFERKMALGMVSDFCLFVRVTTTSTLAINISSHTLVHLSLKHLTYPRNTSIIARKDQLNVWTNYA